MFRFYTELHSVSLLQKTSLCDDSTANSIVPPAPVPCLLLLSPACCSCSLPAAPVQAAPCSSAAALFPARCSWLPCLLLLFLACCSYSG